MTTAVIFVGIINYLVSDSGRGLSWQEADFEGFWKLLLL